MTHRGPFQPLLFCDSVISGYLFYVQLEYYFAYGYDHGQRHYGNFLCSKLLYSYSYIIQLPA